MMTSLLKPILLCFLIILTTAAKEVAEDEVQENEKDKDNSKDHALVAIDAEVTDEEEDASMESFLDPDAEVFEPTDKWQTVKQGQAIPRGLHVRLNLQTGEREAKLMDDEKGSEGRGRHHEIDSSFEEPNQPSRRERMKLAIEKAMKDLEIEREADKRNEKLKYWKKDDREGMVNLEKTTFTHDELKEALKKFKSEHDDVQDPSIDAESSSKQFRTIDEIREDFRRLNVDMKTDLEILSGIMKKYKNNEISDEERLALLNDLEYYVHQIDNAQNFADMGGFQVLLRDLNSTSEDIRKESALVLASAVQSNPKAQVVAVESGTMQKLIRMMSVEESVAVRSRVLSALSSLIRNFPFAQQKFLELGGLDSLTLLIKHPEVSEKLSVKAVTLVNDLLVEQVSTETDEHISPALREEKMNQYSRVPLFASVVEQGWCWLVPKLLDLPDHDSVENVLNAMWTLRGECDMYFDGVLPQLNLLKTEYLKLSQEEMEEGTAVEDSYYTVLLQDINRLMKHIVNTKDEL